MTSPTTPRDAIGLSERLRAAHSNSMQRINGSDILLEAATQLDALSADTQTKTQAIADLARAIHELRSERVALQARVKELEEHNRRLGQGGAERYWEGRYRDEAAERTALSLDLEKVQTELDQEHACATRAEQERDEALERAAKVAEQMASERRHREERGGFSPATATPAANSYWCEEIAAAIRRLAAGPDKEKRE